MVYISKFPNNLVLQFDQLNKLSNNKKILVFSTKDEMKFKVEYNFKNSEVLDLQQIKQLWVDSIVNSFVCSKNEIFSEGFLDCVSEEVREQMIKFNRENKNQIFLDSEPEYSKDTYTSVDEEGNIIQLPIPKFERDEYIENSESEKVIV